MLSFKITDPAKCLICISLVKINIKHKFQLTGIAVQTEKTASPY